MARRPNHPFSPTDPAWLSGLVDAFRAAEALHEVRCDRKSRCDFEARFLRGKRRRNGMMQLLKFATIPAALLAFLVFAQVSGGFVLRTSIPTVVASSK
jgi:hypothetical protein